MTAKMFIDSTNKAKLQCYKCLSMNGVRDNEELAKNQSCAAVLFDKKLKKGWS